VQGVLFTKWKETSIATRSVASIAANPVGLSCAAHRSGNLVDAVPWAGRGDSWRYSYVVNEGAAKVSVLGVAVSWLSCDVWNHNLRMSNIRSGIGRLTSVSDAAGTLSRSYDQLGNLLTDARTTSAAMLTTVYTYDAANRIASITYPSGTAVTYARDTMGRITSASVQPSGGASTLVASGVTYEPFGPDTGFRYGSAGQETRGFDQDYRLTNITDLGDIRRSCIRLRPSHWQLSNRIPIARLYCRVRIRSGPERRSCAENCRPLDRRRADQLEASSRFATFRILPEPSRVRRPRRFRAARSLDD
jgi:YD repeat-containing protein